MSRARAASAWFLGSLGLYVISTAPGPLWGDSAKLAIYALHGYWPSANPGDHPGLTLLARAWLVATSWLDPVRSLHLLSAFAGAAAVALVFCVVVRATGDRVAAHSTATVLLVAHPLWWSAAVTESYAPAVAAVLLVALAATNDASPARLAWAGFAAGLACAIHGFTLLLTLPWLLVVPLRRVAAAAAGFVVGAAPIWLALLSHPADPLTGHQAGTLKSWGWHAALFLDPKRLAMGLPSELTLIAYALGPLGLVGLGFAIRRGAAPAHPRAMYGWIATVVLLVILAIYSPFRLHLMVALPLVAILLLVPPRLPIRLRLAQPALQALLYLMAPLVATTLGFESLGVRRLPERDNANYFLNPVKLGERGPERYAHELLAACPPQTVVLADFNPGAVLRLVQEREHLRDDVVVVPTAIDEALGHSDPATAVAERIDAVLAQGRPAVLADSWEPYYRRRELEDRGYRLTPCGPGMRAWAPSDRPR